MVKKEQTRTCIVTRKAGTKDELIRFVLGPEQEVVADIREKLPGRGVWVTNSRQAVEKAVTKNLFSAGFKQKVRVSADIVKNVEDLLIDAIEQGLSMAKKSGRLRTKTSSVRTRKKPRLFIFCDSNSAKTRLRHSKTARPCRPASLMKIIRSMYHQLQKMFVTH